MTNLMLLGWVHALLYDGGTSSKAGDVCWCLWSGFLLYEDVAMHGDSASSNGLVVRGAAKHSQDQGLLPCMPMS